MDDISVKQKLAECAKPKEGASPDNTDILALASETAQFLLSLVEQRTKNNDSLDIETLTDDLVSFIHSKDPNLAEKQIPDVLDAVSRQIACLTKSTQDESYRSFLIFSTGLVLSQIKESYHPRGSFPEERSGMTTARQDYSIPDRNRVNSLSVDYWKELKRFRLDTGAFTTGWENADRAFYARGLKSFVGLHR